MNGSIDTGTILISINSNPAIYTISTKRDSYWEMEKRLMSLLIKDLDQQVIELKQRKANY